MSSKKKRVSSLYRLWGPRLVVDTESVAAAIALYKKKHQLSPGAKGEYTEMTLSEALGVFQMLQYTAREVQVRLCYNLIICWTAPLK